MKLTNLEELASFYSDGVRANPFTKDLTLFIERQKADDDDIEMRGRPLTNVTPNDAESV